MMSTRMFLGLVGLVCSLVVMLQGSADYPAKPVRIIEPFGAGGGPDIIARAISPKLTELWGQLVTVENLPPLDSLPRSENQPERNPQTKRLECWVCGTSCLQLAPAYRCSHKIGLEMM